jgi:hypothetical protein
MSAPDQPEVTLAQAMKNLRNNLPALLDGVRLEAQIQRERFLALKREGFTDQQALELCKAAKGFA